MVVMPGHIFFRLAVKRKIPLLIFYLLVNIKLAFFKGSEIKMLLILSLNIVQKVKAVSGKSPDKESYNLYNVLIGNVFGFLLQYKTS